MPKMTDRERLAKLEADQKTLAREAESVRQVVRAHYGSIAAELPVESLSEREFRDVLTHAIRVGGGASVGALKALPAEGHAIKTPPERRPSDEHGGAARRRPAAPEAAASAGDGPGH
jgi:hypothetical protein